MVADTSRGRVFSKLVYVLMTRPGKKFGPLSFYIWGLSFKTNLFNCEADPLNQDLKGFLSKKCSKFLEGEG